MTTRQGTGEKKPIQTAVFCLLGIMLFSVLLVDRWYLRGDHGASASEKALAVVVGVLIIDVWWAWSIPVARIVEKRNKEGLRALFWLPWIGLSLALSIIYFAIFVPRLSLRTGANLGGSFAFLLTAPVVFASSWRNTQEAANRPPEVTPDKRSPLTPSPPSNAP
jgi:hypothetical protein